jgi:predicted secreted protein
MKKKLFLVLFSILLASCGDHLSDKPIVVNYSDRDKSISIYVGQRIDISLVENSVKGKVWGICPYKTTVIGFISSRFQPDVGISGSGGYRIIRFRALHLGISKLKIVYYETKQAKVTPIKEFEISVHVINPKN